MDGHWRALLPRQLRAVPADLVATVLLTGLAVFVAVVPVVRTSVVRIAFGLPLLCFLPGYALVAALFPEDGDSTDRDSTDPANRDSDVAGRAAGSTAGHGDVRGGSISRRFRGLDGGDTGIDGIERTVLSGGLSIALAGLIGVGLAVTPWGLELSTVLVSMSGVTVGCSAVATARRWALPPGERFRVPYRAWYTTGRAELLAPESRADAALNVLLVGSVLLAVGSVGYAIAVPPDGERYTEFYLVTGGEDGDVVAADYPEELVVGAEREVVVGITNHERRAVNYTVVVQLQVVDLLGPGGERANGTAGANETREAGGTGGGVNETPATQVRVLDRHEVDRFRSRLSHDRTTRLARTVSPPDVVDADTPDVVGENRRLQYLLYRGSAPPTANRSSSYRDLHLWVDVVGSGEG